ncbi:unnamed protein product [Sphagnum troendelagicum]|uniref:Uncharacterized protein n=1 Tax=Sphagnum troendelagicum TaxID=128251 RepID=A0ABP0TDQ3_9BRYO
MRRRNSQPQSQNETKIRTPQSQQNATRNFERGTRRAARVRYEQNRERRLRIANAGRAGNAKAGNLRTQQGTGTSELKR